MAAGVIALAGLGMSLLGHGPSRQRGAAGLLAFGCNPAVLLGLWSLSTGLWDPRAEILPDDVMTVSTQQDGIARTVTVGADRFTDHQQGLGPDQQSEAVFPLDGPRRQFIEDEAERLLAPVTVGAGRGEFTCIADVHHHWDSWSVSVSGSRQHHLSSEHCGASSAESAEEAEPAEPVDVSRVWAIMDRIESAKRAPLVPLD